MAMFLNGEEPTEDPFTEHLSPIQVASSIQTALEAAWHNLPRSERNAEAVRRSILAEFPRVEAWWMALSDRRAHRIVQESQVTFGMPRELADAAKRGELTHEQMYQWLPPSQLADAIFWAWLLQPQDSRDAAKTITLVRKIIDRELISLADDLATFG